MSSPRIWQLDKNSGNRSPPRGQRTPQEEVRQHSKRPVQSRQELKPCGHRLEIINFIFEFGLVSGICWDTQTVEGPASLEVWRLALRSPASPSLPWGGGRGLVSRSGPSGHTTTAPLPHPPFAPRLPASIPPEGPGRGRAGGASVTCPAASRDRAGDGRPPQGALGVGTSAGASRPPASGARRASQPPGCDPEVSSTSAEDRGFPTPWISLYAGSCRCMQPARVKARPLRSLTEKEQRSGTETGARCKVGVGHFLG